MLKKNLVQPKFFFCTVCLLISSIAFAQNDVPVSAEKQLKQAAKSLRLQEYRNAIKQYRDLANAGNAEAQYQLASIYLAGKGIKKNEDAATTWLEKAAAQQHTAASYTLGVLIKNSNSDRSKQLIGYAAKQEYAPAITFLNRIDAQSSRTANSSDNDLAIQTWFMAARRGQVDELLSLSTTISVDQTNSDGQTALTAAVDAGELKAVQWLLGKGANPTQKDKYSSDPLLVAVMRNNKPVLNALLKKVKTQLPNYEGDETLLHKAVRLKRLELIPTIISKGVAVNAQTSDGLTALDLAERLNEKSYITLLKQQGGKSGSRAVAENRNVNADKRLAFLQSNAANLSKEDIAKIVVAGDDHLLEEVLKASAIDINEKLSDGSSLLSLAIKNDRADTVDLLLKKQADPNLAVENNNTPIQLAIQNGNKRVIDALLRKGAKLTKKNDIGLDAVSLAIQSEPGIARELLKQARQQGTNSLDQYLLLAAQYDNAEIIGDLVLSKLHTFEDKQQRNALWFAAQNQNARVIKLLLNAKLPANRPDKQGKTPFIVAVEKGCMECAILLLPENDINQVTINGNSPLTIAARNNDQQLTKWLLSNNADLEIRNNQGSTALIAAVEAGAFHTSKLLANAGANVSRKNKLGFSALDIAEATHPDIYSELKSKSGLSLF